MKNREDFHWNNSTELSSRDFVCGHCGREVSSNLGFEGWLRISNLTKAPVHIYVCHGCSRPNYFSGKYHSPVYKNKPTEFSEDINRISPKFVAIYNQAEIAESEELDEVAGVGYGKAFEFLIKDYLLEGEESEDMIEAIKAKSLHQCIDDHITHNKIKKAASNAKILRNEETHYEREIKDKDTQDLKKLIEATIHWIELDIITETKLK